MWDGGHDAKKKRTGTAGLSRPSGRHRLRGNVGWPRWITANERAGLRITSDSFCAGGGVRLRLAGGPEAGQPSGGDLQGGRRDAHSRADDRPAEDVGHRQSGHHSSVRRGQTSQVCMDINLLCLWLKWWAILFGRYQGEGGERAAVEGQQRDTMSTGCSSLKHTKAVASLQCSERILCGSVKEKGKKKRKRTNRERRQRVAGVETGETRHRDRKAEAFVEQELAKSVGFCLFLWICYLVISAGLVLLQQSFAATPFFFFLSSHLCSRSWVSLNKETLLDAGVVLQNGYRKTTPSTLCVFLSIKSS